MKTIQYNDLSSYSYQELRDFEYMLSIFRDFVKNGGNLDLNLNVDNKIMSIFDFINTKFESHPEYFTQLIDEKLIKSPFSFIVNDKEKTITDLSNYGLRFMKNNYKTYQKEIDDSILKLAQEIHNWDIGSYPKTRRGLEKSQINEENNNNPTYIYNTYDSVLQTKYRHPLMHLILELNSPSLLGQILNLDKKYLKILETENLEEYVTSFGNNSNFTHILYKYGVLDHILHSKNPEEINEKFDKETINDVFNEIVKNTIRNDDIETIKKLAQHISLKENDLFNSTDFLSLAKSEDMVKLLLDQGVYYLYTIDPKNQGRRTYSKNSLLEIKNLDMFEAIIRNTPELQKCIKERPEDFYYMVKSSDNKLTFEKLKVATEKFDFPINNFDVISIAYYTNEFKENLEWLNQHGYDPRKCSDFIISLVQKRGEGIKLLKELQKANLFNAASPDPIYWMLREATTKDYYTYLEKISEKQLSRLTISGEPAWWGLSHDYGISLVKNNIKDFHQKSSNNYSYLYYLIKNSFREENYNDFKYSNNLEKITKETKQDFDITGYDEDNNNIFHHLFNYEVPYVRKSINYIFFLEIMKSKQDFGTMLMEKNNYGKTPLDHLFHFIEATDATKKNTKTLDLSQQIIMRGLETLDLSMMVTIRKSFFDNSNDNELIEVNLHRVLGNLLTKTEDLVYLDRLYENQTLYKDLNNELSTKKEEKSKVLKV